MTVKAFSIDGHLYEAKETDLSFELKSGTLSFVFLSSSLCTLRSSYIHLGRAPESAKDFLRTLALCHAVVPTIVGEKGSKEIVWKSPSPDEEALVQARLALHFFLFYLTCTLLGCC